MLMNNWFLFFRLKSFSTFKEQDEGKTTYNWYVFGNIIIEGCPFIIIGQNGNLLIILKNHFLWKEIAYRIYTSLWIDENEFCCFRLIL